MRPRRSPGRWRRLPDAAARAHLAAIAARPRPAGGASEAGAREYCAEVLRRAGFAVREEDFSYSASVGRWAMPLAGAAIAGAVCAAASLVRAGAALLALTALVGTAAAIALGARWATREGVLRLPTERRRATNLIATRGSETPALWLVAHLDSKSQPVPMLARVIGVAGSAVVWLVAIALALIQLAGAGPSRAWPVLAVVAVVIALPVIGSVIGARSPGALDNASGVATVLLAAAGPLDAPALPAEVGVLVTSAEELGLAGARAWARSGTGQRVAAAWRHAPEMPVALNVDGVDDAGPLAALVQGAPGPRLAAALAAEATVVVRRVPPGVLVDAIALADAGFEALTVSKGTVRTLARIHTVRDSLDALTGAGVPEAAALLRRLAVSSAMRQTEPAAAAAPRHARRV